MNATETRPTISLPTDPPAERLCQALAWQKDPQLRAGFVPGTGWTMEAIVHGVTLTARPRQIARFGRLDGHEFALRVEGDPRVAYVFSVADDGTVADVANGPIAKLTDEASVYAATEPLLQRIASAVLASHVFAPTLA